MTASTEWPRPGGYLLEPVNFPALKQGQPMLTYCPQKATASLFQTLAELRAAEQRRRERAALHRARMNANATGR